MESYENLRLEQKDKIRKCSFWERFTKKESEILEENLDFLEERYQKTNQDSAPTIQENLLFQDSKENLVLLDDLMLKTNLSSNAETQQTASLNPQEKEAVLEVDFISKEIPFKVVCMLMIAMFAIFLLFMPKIYIRNNIYYTSRNLIQLQAQLDSLNEENKHIKKQLEDIKFKNLTHELDF
ncbi:MULTISPECIES: hypothetical protein [Helicobacter]|uniref:Uncharacterized protein n=1 Tax=Helicobacter ganmani TaxID=60246 RepID=A0A3D8IGW9_9HELI|nr:MULTISPECIES: hypothetical protein [Helicobacter]RDU64363.1 hypothetical protein CQA43_00695 [Helicobacter ganmani]